MNNVTYKPAKAGIHVVVFRVSLKKEKSNNPKKIEQGKCKLVKTVIAKKHCPDGKQLTHGVISFCEVCSDPPSAQVAGLITARSTWLVLLYFRMCRLTAVSGRYR